MLMTLTFACERYVHIFIIIMRDLLLKTKRLGICLYNGKLTVSRCGITYFYSGHTGKYTLFCTVHDTSEMYTK